MRSRAGMREHEHILQCDQFNCPFYYSSIYSTLIRQAKLCLEAKQAWDALWSLAGSAGLAVTKQESASL